MTAGMGPPPNKSDYFKVTESGILPSESHPAHGHKYSDKQCLFILTSRIAFFFFFFVVFYGVEGKTSHIIRNKKYNLPCVNAPAESITT